jgi:hypothetical protein
MKTRIAGHVAIYLFIALTGYGIGACRQSVMVNPSEDDLLVLNGCVVQLVTPIAFGKRTAQSTDTIATLAGSLFRFTHGTQNRLRLCSRKNYRNIFTRTSQ